MPSTDLIRLPLALTPAEFWPALARDVHVWLHEQSRPARDAVLLLPFVELVQPARQAFAASPGWQPRIETVQTLCASAGPQPPAGPGECGLDPALDRLLAADLLRRQAGLDGWQRRDPWAFDAAVSALVDATHALLRGVAAVAPAARPAWWQQAREALPASHGASAMAGLLAQAALEWAAMSPPPASDRLLALRPSAWLVLSAGNAAALADPWHSLLLAQSAAQGIASLHLCADAAGDLLFDAAAAPDLAAPEVWLCADAEQEAVAAASAVLQALTDAKSPGQPPVALIAEDRLLVRRTRALLERAGVAVADESGWSLDTTRAGARIMALLRAAHPAAGDDARLDWLKGDLGPADARWLQRLERRWRRAGDSAGPARNAEPSELDLLADQQWAVHKARLQALVGRGPRSLSGWQAALCECLASSPQAKTWASDAAGREVWQALRLDTVSAGLGVEAQDEGAASGISLSLDGFSRWVDAALVDGFFRPRAAQAQVVITPMARAMLRPFSRVVLPGADERHLGPPAPGPTLLGDGLLRQLGLPDAAQRGQRLARCFVLLLRQPGTLLIRRHAEGDEPLAPSPWIARLGLARRRRGLAPLVERAAPLVRRSVTTTRVHPPTPSAAGALPAQLSASALQVLRACPYRFYARSVLGLAQPEELETDPGKRDYGSWLHAALHQFHEQRLRDGDTTCDDSAAARLMAAAQDAAAEQGLDTAALLPFQAGLRAFARRYLAWLSTHEAQGWRYAAGELAIEQRPDGLPTLQGLRLAGRIDRIDRQPEAGAATSVLLLDYKTGAAGGLQQQLKRPLEDTQLAFYAAQLLVGDVPGLSLADGATLQAAYLALDERQAIVELPHAEVAASAQALLDGLADEWPRMAAGEPLRALGEGQVCDFCEMRGLCRRDHWSSGLSP